VRLSLTHSLLLTLCALPVVGIVASASLRAQQERPLTLQRADSVAVPGVIRMAPDEFYLQRGIVVQCYMTNPDRFGEGHPSLACVVFPLNK
jgi:hypothetical protein